MYPNSLLTILALGVATMLATGCVHNGGQFAEMNEDTGIEIAIKNNGTERIEDATIKFGEYQFSVGIVSPGHKKVHVCSGQTVPAVAEISFELQSGKFFKKIVSVKDKLPLPDRGPVILHFNIDANQNVGIEFFRSEKVSGRSRLVPY